MFRKRHASNQDSSSDLHQNEQDSASSNLVDTSSETPLAYDPPRSVSEPSITPYSPFRLRSERTSRPPLAGTTGLSSSTFSSAYDGSQPVDSANSLGLFTIHNPLDAMVDIIFVHGLGGSRQKTWSWQKLPANFWPAWLPKDPSFPSARIFTFGYNSIFYGPKTPLSILDFAKDLLSRMKGYHDPSALLNGIIGQRPIIFVAHSMGGLIVKKALIVGKHNDQFKEMVEQVSGIIFMATPHKGSSKANSLNNILSAALGTSQKVYVAEISQHSSFLADLNEQFRSVCDNIRLHSFYETLATKLVAPVSKLVVPRDSAILGYPREDSTPMNTDHHTICKFKSPDDQNFEMVKSTLSQLIRESVSLDVLTATTRVSATSLSNTSLNNILGILNSPGETLSKAQSQSIPGSCQWLLERKVFRDWESKSKFGSTYMLWLSGLPGTGKSTVAGMTVKYLQEKYGEHSSQYHFFVDGQPTQRSTAYCLRSIAYQLANTNPEFANRLQHFHADTGVDLRNQKAQIIWEKLFESIIFRMEFEHPLYWVIDALDESDNPIDLVKRFFQMNSLPRIKIFILSRPSTEFSSIALSRPNSIAYGHFSVEDTKNDIQAYVSTTMGELFPHNDVFQKSITSQILARAEGSFLWAKLALSTLKKNWHTQADIRRALDDVPSGMEALYDKIIEMINANEDRYQRMAYRILTWAACAFRPIQLSELEIALQPEFQDFVSLQDTITNLCGHFIRIDSENVSLIHSTARAYLLKQKVTGHMIIDPKVGHEHLAMVCLRYMSNEKWRKKVILTQGSNMKSAKAQRLQCLHKELPFFEYATSHWAYHLSLAAVDSSALIELCKLFCDKYILAWIYTSAYSGGVKTITRSAQYMKTFLHRHKRFRRSNNNPPKNLAYPDRTADIRFMERWIVDLIRIVGRFGLDLLREPTFIFTHIPPLCPKNSIIHETYASEEESLISVSGVSSGSWGDNISRITVSQDEIVSKVIATESYFVALMSSNGTLVVFFAETCEELRRLQHQEYVTMIAANRGGSRVASAGRFTFRVWNLSTGQQLHSFPKDAHARSMYFNFLHSDEGLIVGYDDCSIVTYDLRLGKEIRRYVADEIDEDGHSCPRLVSISPDQSKAALAFRGRPVLLWDLNAPEDQVPKKCIRETDSRKWDKEEGEVWCCPEVVRWLPNSNTLYILYQDTSLLEWRLGEDRQKVFTDTHAREFLINSDGTLLLSSDRDGTLSIWGIPKLSLVYRLQYDEFLRDIAWSPDSQRIYDARGSKCNVWEPDALIRPEDLENEDMSSTDASFVSEPVLSKGRNSQSEITALACMDSDLAYSDQFFCCGWDEGAVTLHEMANGKKIRRVFSHSDNVSVISLAWSPQGRFLISGDDSGRVIAKRLNLKEDGKWAVFGVFDIQLDENVHQFVFSPDEKLVLISTTTTDSIWKTGPKQSIGQVVKERWGGQVGRRWIKHPGNNTALLWVDPDKLHIYKWDELARIKTIDFQRPVFEQTVSALSPEISRSPAGSTKSNHPEQSPLPAFSRPTNINESVQAVSQTSNRRYIVWETLPEMGPLRVSFTEGLSLHYFRTSNLDSDQVDGEARHNLNRLAKRVQRFLVCYRDKIAFLDHDNQICTHDLNEKVENVRSHFFIPRDWLNSANVPLITLNQHGTVLCPRNGEVALIRYSNQF